MCMASVSLSKESKKTTAYTERIDAGRFPIFLILPAVAIILIVLGYPLIYSLYVSFTPYELLKPNSFHFELSGMFDNYIKLFNNDLFWQSLKNTVIFLAVTVNLTYLIALALSQLMARVTFGLGLMRTILMVPMMFAPIMVGFQFRWFFNANLGLVNNFLFELGLLQEPGQIAWLVDRPLGMISIMVATIWMNLPVMTIILLAGTLSLPKETFEAADVDGASV